MTVILIILLFLQFSVIYYLYESVKELEYELKSLDDYVQLLHKFWKRQFADHLTNQHRIIIDDENI